MLCNSCLTDHLPFESCDGPRAIVAKLYGRNVYVAQFPGEGWLIRDRDNPNTDWRVGWDFLCHETWSEDRVRDLIPVQGGEIL